MQEKLSFKIKAIVQETADAKTYVLEPLDGEKVAYQPGQFLTLLVPFNGTMLRRAYSFSSTPDIDPYMSITIKHVQNGDVSRYLLSTLKEGDILEALPPAGRFILTPQTQVQRDIFLIGAGSGITPLFSILKCLLWHEPQSKIYLIYSNVNESTAIFWQQINDLERSNPDQLKCYHFLSNPMPGSGYVRARLNIDVLEALVMEQQQFRKEVAVFMLCGPHSFMRMAQMILTYMGFHREQILKEVFEVQLHQSSATSVKQDFEFSNATIHLNAKEYQLLIPAGKTVLDAALEKGIALPFSCKGGVCSTCIGRCSGGKIEMTINQVLTPKEVEAGYILSCVSYPLSEKVSLWF